MSLRQKTVTGIFWSSVESIAAQTIQFIFGIILARILSPKEFGLIGMVTVFIAVSETFIYSGFGSALIRKKDCTQEDYSTVFFFNFAVGIIFFLLLFFSAPAISRFFNEAQLKAILRVLAIVLILDSLSIIQHTILTKRIDFKLQTRISVMASGTAGAVAIILALKGFGVWCLVVQTLLRQGIRSFLLWIWNRWRPDLVFSKKSFTELFSFGSKLLLSSLINTIYNNIYQLVIGKFFSATDLGFYTRAWQFQSLPSTTITNVVTRVAYPVLAQIQEDNNKLKEVYKRMIKSTMLITFIFMMGLAAVAEPMIISFIGEKWRTSIVYLQMLCFCGMFFPLSFINLNMLDVHGRSDLTLKLEVIKKLLSIPTIFIGILLGIKLMIVAMMLNSIIAYFLNSYFSGRFVNYSVREQLLDIAPAFLIAAAMGVTVYTLGYFLPTSYLLKLAIQVLTGALLIFIICEVTKMPDYFYLKQIVAEKVLKTRQ